MNTGLQHLERLLRVEFRRHLAHRWRNRAANRLQTPPDQPPLRVGTVLVALEYLSARHPALICATALARQFQARLVLVHVVEPLYVLVCEAAAGFMGACEAAKEEAKERLKTLTKEADADEGLLMEGKIDEEIVRTATAEHADLIVMGRYERTGLRKLWRRNLTDRVIDHAPCPVVCVHEPPASAPARAA